MLHDFTGYSAFVFNLRKLVGSATSAKLDFHKILSGAAKWLATKTRRVLRNLFSWLSLLDLFGLAAQQSEGRRYSEWPLTSVGPGSQNCDCRF